MPFLQHDFLNHKHFFHNLVFGHAREYFRATWALGPFSLAPTSSDTTSVFTALHLELNNYFLFFLKDYELDQDFKLSFDSFKLTFKCMPHLLASGPFEMVFEHLRDCFHLKNSTSGFPQLFQLCFYIAKGHIPPQIAFALGITHFLVMTKPDAPQVPWGTQMWIQTKNNEKVKSLGMFLGSQHFEGVEGVLELRDGTRNNDKHLITHSDLHKPNNKLVSA